MTDQQELFATEYVKLRCKSATQAAKNAGYSEKSAHSMGSYLLKNPEVRKRIDELLGQINQEVRDKFAVEASNAIDALIEVVNDPGASNTDKIRAATEMLHIAGYVAKSEISIDTPDKVVITRKKRDAD